MSAMPEPTLDDEFDAEREALDAVQIGKIVHRSPRWVRDEMQAGRLPVSFKIGRTRYVYRDQLRAYMAGGSA